MKHTRTLTIKIGAETAEHARAAQQHLANALADGETLALEFHDTAEEDDTPEEKAAAEAARAGLTIEVSADRMSVETMLALVEETRNEAHEARGPEAGELKTVLDAACWFAAFDTACGILDNCTGKDLARMLQDDWRGINNEAELDAWLRDNEPEEGELRDRLREHFGLYVR